MFILGKSDWKENECQLLLSLYAENIHHLATDERVFWNNVVKGMWEKEIYKTEPKCKIKIKNLRQAYRECVDHNSRSGVDPYYCNFYEVSNLNFYQTYWKTINYST